MVGFYSNSKRSLVARRCGGSAPGAVLNVTGKGVGVGIKGQPEPC